MLSKKIIVFSGPSGVGKATIEEKLFEDKSLNLGLSISSTTRKARVIEEEGKHYYFVSEAKFQEQIKDEEFLEWNEHFGNKYGTLKKEIRRLQSESKVPFFEVEVIGAKNIIDTYHPEDVISIFISPPTKEELEKRIKQRGTETQEQIKLRLARLDEEMSYLNFFQFNVINNSLNDAVEEIKKILMKELYEEYS